MRRRVVTTRRAHEDIENAVEYYLTQGATDAAHGLTDAIEDAADLISQHPSLGSSRFAVDLEFPGLRGFALRCFPYVLFYTDDSDAVRINRVLHTSRDIPAEFSV